MSNAKAVAFNAQMDKDAKVRELELLVADKDSTIIELRNRIAQLEEILAAAADATEGAPAA